MLQMYFELAGECERPFPITNSVAFLTQGVRF